MNRTTQKKYDLAAKMLQGKIEVDEIALMTGLTVDQINKLKRDVVLHDVRVENPADFDNYDLKGNKI